MSEEQQHESDPNVDPDTVVTDSGEPDPYDQPVELNPAFMSNTDARGMSQPLSHGLVDPSVTVGERISNVLGGGLKLGKRFVALQMPTTNEWIIGILDIVGAGVAINSYMGKPPSELQGFYLSSVQILFGALVAAN